MTTLSSLADAILAVCPIEGVSGAQGSIRIDFRAGATGAQQTAANNVVATFDWSDAAEATRVAQFAKAVATASIDNGALQKGIPMDRLVRSVALVMLSEINLIRANFATPMTPRTAAQIVPAIKAQIALTAE